MISFKKTKIKDLEIIHYNKFKDFRGFFSRLYCAQNFKKRFSKIVQINFSFSKDKFTLRGLHFQNHPNSEDKVVKCIKGKIFDVAVDLRKNSNTYGKWVSVVLSEKNNKMFLIPKGFAHGFMTLENNCEIMYFVSNYYKKKKESGIRYNDSFFNIKWPANPKKISKKDLSWKLIKKI
jgi:dTDP-4-dehydrorhamnose 3,5-epimerase